MSFEKKSHISMRDILISGIKGFILSIIVGTVLLFGFTAIAFSVNDPTSVTAPLGYAALYISVISGGIAAARFSGDTSADAAICGGVSGLMMFVLLLFMSFLPTYNAESVSSLTSILMYGSIPVSATISGFIFKRKPSRKARHRRRR